MILLKYLSETYLFYKKVGLEFCNLPIKILSKKPYLFKYILILSIYINYLIYYKYIIYKGRLGRVGRVKKIKKKKKIFFFI